MLRKRKKKKKQISLRYHRIKKKKKNWRETKKVGSFIGDKEDVGRRKQLIKLKHIWIEGDKIKTQK